MTTTVVKTIGLGGDYTSLQAWNDAAPSSLVTADEIWEGRVLAAFDSSAATSTVLTIGGSTSDVTRYKLLRANIGAGFADNTNVAVNALRYNASNGAAISATVGYSSPVIDISEQYARIHGLQVANVGAQVALRLSAANVRVDSCIIEASANSFALPLHITGANSLTINTLVINRYSGTPQGAISLESVSSGAFVNVTAVIPSDLTAASSGLFFTSYSSGITAKNCAAFGGPITNAAAITFTTCANEHSSPPTGVTQLAYNTTTGSGFAATTDSVRDFRILTTSALKDAGTTDTTDAPTDIAGTVRPSGSAFDIGAWEFASAPFAAAINCVCKITPALTARRNAITPAWATNAINHWIAVPNSTQDGSPVDPANLGIPYSTNVTGKTNNDRLSFSGVALAVAALIQAACGGHTDYHGNEVTFLDMAQDSPGWVIKTLPSNPLPNPTTGQTANTFAYAVDGQPVAGHTYWIEEYLYRLDKVFRTHTSFAGTGGISYPTVDGWKLSTATWDAAGTWSNTQATTTCMDSHGVLWGQGVDNHLWSFNPDLGASAWTDVGAIPGGTNIGNMCDDPVYDRLMQFVWGDGQGGGTAATTFCTLSKTSSAGSVTQVTQTVNSSAAYTAWQALTASYQSMIYIPQLDQFWVFAGGQSTTIYSLSRGGTANTWDMAVVTLFGATIPLCAGSVGSYNRFRYSDDLRGVVYFPDGSKPVYYLRLEGTPAPSPIVESGTTSDTVSCVVICAGTMTESGTASDSPSSIKTSPGVMSETGTATDAPVGKTTTGSTITESGTAAETLVGVGGAFLAITEAGMSADTLSDLLSTSQTIAESGTAADTGSAIMTTAGAIAESGTAVDTSSTSGGSSTQTVTESGTAVDITSSIKTSPGAIAEAGAAADAPSVTGSLHYAQTEAGAAADATDGLKGANLALTEAGTAADTLSQAWAAGCFMSEVLNAADSSGNSAAFVAHAVESGTATDLEVAGGVLTIALSELGAVSEFVSQIGSVGLFSSESMTGSDTIEWLTIAFSLLRTYKFAVEDRSFAFPAENRSFTFPKV